MAEKPLTVQEEVVKRLLIKAGEDCGQKPSSALAMKLAIFRYFADEFACPEDERQEAWKNFRALPGSFGSNASAMSARFGWKQDKEPIVDGFKA